MNALCNLKRAMVWGEKMLADAEAGHIPDFEKRDWNGAALYAEILRLRKMLENQRECTRTWVWKAEQHQRDMGLDCHGVGHADGSHLCRECLLEDKIALWDVIEREMPGHPALKRGRHAPPGLWRRIKGSWRAVLATGIFDWRTL